jgi:gamma-tubulin complex component 2
MPLSDVLTCRFVKNLEVAYKYANQTLLNLLMKDQQLIGRLR